MPKNRLTISPVTCSPKHIPAEGGEVTVEFKAATSQEDAQASVKYAVGAGPAYRLVGNPTSAPTVKKAATPGTEVSKNVSVRRTSNKIESSFDIEVTASIPGDSPQTHSCTVYLDNPLSTHLKAMRIDADLTQAELAGEIGVARSTISSIERGGNASPRVEEAIVKMMREKAEDHD